MSKTAAPELWRVYQDAFDKRTAHHWHCDDCRAAWLTSTERTCATWRELNAEMEDALDAWLNADE